MSDETWEVLRQKLSQDPYAFTQWLDTTIKLLLSFAKQQGNSPEIEDAILAWTGQYPYSDKGYCYLCGEIDGHKDVDWPLGVHENGETERAILPCPIGLLETKHD